MARKIVTVVIDKTGRDTGKVFVLREMPASQAERWALRALSALVASGVDVPDDLMQLGMAGVARIGLQAFGKVDWGRLEPLLVEMFQCVTIQPGHDPSVTRVLVEDDIEDIATRLTLRKELLVLHVDFSTAAEPLIPGLAAASIRV